MVDGRYRPQLTRMLPRLTRARSSLYVAARSTIDTVNGFVAARISSSQDYIDGVEEYVGTPRDHHHQTMRCAQYSTPVLPSFVECAGHTESRRAKLRAHSDPVHPKDYPSYSASSDTASQRIQSQSGVNGTVILHSKRFQLRKRWRWWQTELTLIERDNQTKELWYYDGPRRKGLVLTQSMDNPVRIQVHVMNREVILTASKRSNRVRFRADAATAFDVWIPAIRSAIYSHRHDQPPVSSPPKQKQRFSVAKRIVYLRDLASSVSSNLLQAAARSSSSSMSTIPFSSIGSTSLLQNANIGAISRWHRSQTYPRVASSRSLSTRSTPRAVRRQPPNQYDSHDQDARIEPTVVTRQHALSYEDRSLLGIVDETRDLLHSHASSSTGAWSQGDRVALLRALERALSEFLEESLTIEVILDLLQVERAATPSTPNSQYYAVIEGLTQRPMVSSDNNGEGWTAKMETLVSILKIGLYHATIRDFEMDHNDEAQEVVLFCPEKRSLRLDDSRSKAEYRCMLKAQLRNIAQSPSGVDDAIETSVAGDDETLKSMVKLLQVPLFGIISSPFDDDSTAIDQDAALVVHEPVRVVDFDGSVHVTVRARRCSTLEWLLAMRTCVQESQMSPLLWVCHRGDFSSLLFRRSS